MRLLLVASASLAALAVVASVSDCSQNPDKSCTLLGCTSSARVVVVAKASLDQMRTAKVTACRNNACATGTPAIVPSVAGDKEEMTLAGAASVQAYISMADGGGYTIEADFAIDDSASAVNGDTYDLHVTDATGGTTLGSVKGTAKYVETTPNGAGCPPVCKNATIQ